MPLKLKTIAAVLLSIFACLTPSAARAATRVEKVLPYTGLDNVRVRVVLTSDDAPGDVELTGKIVPAGANGQPQPLWEGSLGKVRVKPGAPAELEKTVKGLKPQLWTPATPALYTLTLEARRNGKPLETKPVRFGFRTMEVKGGNLHLNGKPIFLRGIAINPPGRGVPKEVGHSRKFAEDYVRFMRAHNVNIIRLEPESDVWFDVCDELGMMIYQGPYGSPPGHDEKTTKAGQGKNRVPDFNKSIAAYREMFENYVPHPSIVIYLLSNELPYEGKRGAEWHAFLTKAHAFLSKEFPVPFIGNAGYGQGREGDINDVHRYWGWYYNSHLTYYNLRDPRLFGDPARAAKQPLTFSECVGAFTGPTGEFNHIFRKQLGAALGWTGHAEDQLERSQAYQAFIFKHAAESFRTMRATNPRLSGLMPFTILFRNWEGITSFEQMGHNANAGQMARSYSPVLLSWENWTPNVYAGTKLSAFAHVVNDAEDFADLAGATLAYALHDPAGKPVAGTEKTLKLDTIKYYGTAKAPVEISLDAALPTGRYTVRGLISRGEKPVAENSFELFVAGGDWKGGGLAPAGGAKVQLYDPAGKTADALKRLGVAFDKADLKNLRAGVPLVIGEAAWDAELAGATASLKKWVSSGGRVLLLGQSPKGFKADWLPAKIEFNKQSNNDPTYEKRTRPMSDGMHVNPARPWHPALKDVDRDHLEWWSDHTAWDQTKPGFPDIYPVGYGFRLTRAEDIPRTAIIANYDRGLEAIAIAEMFDGGGSVLVTSFKLVPRVGKDPVADRMLRNLVSYVASTAPREVLPLIEKPIRWGDYPTEQGVAVEPLGGLVVNCRWQKPPTAPDKNPLADNTGAWNTAPGDGFLPHGRRVYGPWAYTNATGIRDLSDPKNAAYLTGEAEERDDVDNAARKSAGASPTGTGEFWCRIPSGKKTVVTKVENPSDKPGKIEVQVNGGKSASVEVPPGQTASVTTPIAGGATDVHVRFTADKSLVLLETSFE